MRTLVLVAGWCGRILPALFALALLALALVGLPWLLVGWIGWPLPHHIPSLNEIVTALTSPASDQMMLDAIAVLAWFFWLLFVRDLLIAALEAAIDAAEARRTGRPIAAPARGGGPIRLMTALLVGAIAGTLISSHLRTSTGAVRTAGLAEFTHRPPAAVATASPPAATASAASSADASSAATSAPATASARASEVARPAIRVPPRPALTIITPAGHSTSPHWTSQDDGHLYTVVDGDNLWDIAGQQLGDHNRWREIYVANRGIPQADGYALHDPDEIHIGWRLRLPDRHTDTHSPATRTPSHRQNPPADHSGQAHPAAPTSPTTPAPSPSAPQSAEATPHPSQPADTDPSDADSSSTPAAANSGLVMGSGGWIGAGLAAALATAAIAAGLYRRQRRHLHWPPSTTDTSSPVPDSLTGAVTTGNQVLRDTTPPPPVWGRRSPSPPPPTDSSSPPPLPATEAAIALDHTGTEHGLEDLTGNGLALTGPGAPAAVRAALAAATSAGTLAYPDHRITVYTSRTLLADLLPNDVAAAGLDPHQHTYSGERLELSDTTVQAVARLETEMVYRRRILDQYDLDNPDQAEDGHGMVDAHGLGLLIAPAVPAHLPRLRAVLASSTDLRLGVLLLGEADDMPTLTLAADGTLTDTHHTGVLPSIQRVATLGDRELADILDLVRSAGSTITHDTPEPDQPDEHDTLSGGHGAHATEHETLPEPPAPTGTSGAAPTVQLQILGPPVITVNDTRVEQIGPGRYALLAYLAAHPHGVTRDHALDALYPGIAPEAASMRLRTACSDVRRALRAATDDPNGRYILAEADQYRLDPNAISVDLWTMLTHLHTAAGTTDDTAALTALRAAVDHYRGDFATTIDYPWATEYATTYRTQIIAALARIAEICETDHPDTALAALDQAIGHDPVCEELYQRMMRIQGRLGRTDAVRRTLHRCTQALEAIQTEPSEATRRVATRQLRPPAA
jgi:DNA-binding SARP family transcriptional activator